MSNLIKLSRYPDATLIYLLKYILIGFIHQQSGDKVKGIVIGIWRFQIQISLGYSKDMETVGEIGNA